MCVCVCTCGCPCCVCICAELRSLIEEALQDERLRFNSSSPQATEPRPSTVLAKEREEQSKRYTYHKLTIVSIQVALKVSV